MFFFNRIFRNILFTYRGECRNYSLREKYLGFFGNAKNRKSTIKCRITEQSIPPEIDFQRASQSTYVELSREIGLRKLRGKRPTS